MCEKRLNKLTSEYDVRWFMLIVCTVSTGRGKKAHAPKKWGQTGIMEAAAKKLYSSVPHV